MTISFRIQVQGPNGDKWWEDQEREIGEANTIRGHGRQPEFTGDIEKWGREIIEFYNSGEPPERHRTFIKAEMIEHEIPSLDMTNPVAVLNDGETFSALTGTMIAFPPADMDTDDIETELREDSLYTFTLGADNGFSLKDLSAILGIMVTDREIIFDDSEQTISIR